jgi:NAD(P)-dependent dehydrogenase (short-subunit alcohol dehydrogenase family)
MSLNDKVALVTGAGSGSARPVTGSMSSSQYDRLRARGTTVR